MSWVVFMRGVNVGGHKAFQPSALAKQLAHLGVINVGAAGTFVVPGTPAESKLRAEFLRKLPFTTELMLCRGRELLELAQGDPFPEGLGDDVGRFVSVLAKRPRSLPPLPIVVPAGGQWHVKVIGVTGKFALSLVRRIEGSPVDLSAVLEKSFGASATTRNWNTIGRICGVLEKLGR
jgi:uncharacterized protein (DUF1697 family)